MSVNIVHNGDCMNIMRKMKDNEVDIAITDPPYGIGDIFIPISTGKAAGKLKRRHKIMGWDNCIPSEKYFIELKRISKKQIIWGANYFNCFQNGGALVWYKNNGAPTLSQCEIASLSFKKSVDYVFIQVLGGFVQKNKPIHPTQKPVALYKWLLNQYAKPKDKIFDSHVGSGSSRIASYELGFHFEGCELDKDYYEAQELRFMEFKKKFHNEFYIPSEENLLFKDLI